MTRSRRYVWTDLLVSVFALAVALLGWKATNDAPDRESVSIAPGWMLAGATATVAQRILLDRNVAGVRRSRRRRYVYETVLGVVVYRTLPSRDRVTFNWGVGSCLGAVLYRLYYGVLTPVPEA